MTKESKPMEEQMRTMLAELLNQVMQGISSDPVMVQLWSAMQIGNRAEPQAAFDPYRILGLDRTTVDDQVKRRYRELAVRLHPDTAGVRGTEFLFQLVTAAYQQISKERGW